MQMKGQKLVPLWLFVVVILVLGVVIAASAIVIFEKPQRGEYSGPGVPTIEEYSFQVDANYSYIAIPFEINSSKSFWVNTSIPIMPEGSNGVLITTGLLIGLMNQTAYNSFKDNISMDFLAESTYNSGYMYSYHGTGEGTYYAIYLNELNVTISVSTIISVNVG